MSEQMHEYAKFSTGYAVAALGFSVLQFGDLLDLPAKIVALVCYVFFGLSAMFGFLSISSLAASHKDGDNTVLKADRRKRVNRYGALHSICFIFGFLPLIFLVVLDLMTDLAREVPAVSIECLESFLRGWPVCD